MPRSWPVLVLVASAAGGTAGADSALPADGGAPPAPEAACPAEPEMRQALNVEGASIRVACAVTATGTVQMAAVVPPAGAGDVPARVVVATVAATPAGPLRRRGEVDLAGSEREQIAKIVGDDWSIIVGPARLPGVDWVEVEVIGMGGEDLVTVQSVVSFFVGDGKTMRHLWTGLGDRHERRFDVCRVDTTATFGLTGDGSLTRSRRVSRTFNPPAGIDPDLLDTMEDECVAGPASKETFAVSDDGLDADASVSQGFRARARENRRLYWRAQKSPKDLAKFVASSLSLVAYAKSELGPAPNAAATTGARAIRTTAGFVSRDDYGAEREGLSWEAMGYAAGPAGLRLVQALEALHRNDVGVWLVAAAPPERGRCHRPEDAEPVLRALVDAWTTTGAPVRDAFKPVLAKTLRAMADDACFCEARESRTKVQGAVERNAAIVEKLPEIGPLVARKLRALPARPDASFACHKGN